MPSIGDVARAYTVGLSGGNLVVWSACPKCGKTRWKPTRDKDKLCLSCAASNRTSKQAPITFFGDSSPIVGDVARAATLGLAGDHIMLFDPCIKCGTPHWLRLNQKGSHCTRCAPKATGHQRRDRGHAGRRYNSNGYVFVPVPQSDSLYAMATTKGWAAEHRIVVARRIGRPLRPNEVVHHVNGIRCDNRDNNLQLLTVKTHHSHLATQGYQVRLRVLEERMIRLEAENVLLRVQLGSKPILSQAGEQSLGVCRDLTGDTLQLEGEEKVHPFGKPEDRDA